jgi:hypothetical protein
MATQKSSPGETAIVIVLIYLIAMAIGAALVLGVDAIVHFVAWKPYVEFPWFLLRVGVATGVVVISIALAMVML